MNNPFPRNLPLLRELYLGRFSHLRFLIPFERLDDPDVITVYRGSYTHAGYITDARAELAKIDCDYFIFSHDDVLLNPQLNEASFFETFPIGPKDGFISRVGPPPQAVGLWDWYFGLMAKINYPKSLLFGSGVEYWSLVKHLPDRDALERKLFAAGTGYRNDVQFVQNVGDQVEQHPQRLLIQGNNLPTDLSDPIQAEVRDLSMVITRKLAEVLKLSSQIYDRANTTAEGQEVVRLPIPLVTSGYFTDLYILPKSLLADYAHFVGVASAANLFVEVLAPTLLHSCCDRVWRADELGLDDTGFERRPALEEFADRRLIAIHPFKMSGMTPSSRRSLLTHLRTIAAEPTIRSPLAQPGLMEGGVFDFQGPEASGWHLEEDWGRWSAEQSATLAFYYDPRIAITGLRLSLILPTHERRGAMTGRVRLNGAEWPIAATWPQTTVEVEIAAEYFLVSESNLIEIVADWMVRPSELDRTLQDHRQLGVGLKGFSFF